MGWHRTDENDRRCACEQQGRRDQIVRQIIQGGGNMPAYGKNLTPAEVNAIVAFLATMHPRGEPPARDSAKPSD